MNAAKQLPHESTQASSNVDDITLATNLKKLFQQETQQQQQHAAEQNIKKHEAIKQNGQREHEYTKSAVENMSKIKLNDATNGIGEHCTIAVTNNKIIDDKNIASDCNDANETIEIQETTLTIIKTPLTKTLLKKCTNVNSNSNNNNNNNGSNGNSNATLISTPTCCSSNTNTNNNSNITNVANTSGSNVTSAFDNNGNTGNSNEQKLSSIIAHDNGTHEHENIDEHATECQQRFNVNNNTSNKNNNNNNNYNKNNNNNKHNDGSDNDDDHDDDHDEHHHDSVKESNANINENAENDFIHKTPTSIKCNKCNNNNNIHYNNYNCYYRKHKTRMQPICRIMTLSRGPYSELDKMSLFQDLKLKRRKIDSRCSSDGESVADTSTSSPDLLAPMSPKMCDSGGGGGIGVGGNIGGSLGGSSIVTLSATSSSITTTAPACSSSSSSNTSGNNSNTATPSEPAAPTIVNKASAKSYKSDIKSEHEQTEIHSSSGTVTAAAASSVMSPPTTTIRMSSASPTLPPMDSGGGCSGNNSGGSSSAAIPTFRTTPTPPHNNGTASSTSCVTSNGSGSSRASPDSLDESKPTTTQQQTSTSGMSANGMHSMSSSCSSGSSSGGGSGVSSGVDCSIVGTNLSVIRSVKEERNLASPTRLSAHQHQQHQHQLQQQSSKMPTQSQQHVTVLVTPSRIKSEGTAQTALQQNAAKAAMRASSTPSPQPMLTQLHPPPPIVQTHHLHQQLTQPLTRKNSPPTPTSLQLTTTQQLLTQSMQHLTQQQQLQILQQAAAMSRPSQMSLNAAMSPNSSSRHSSSHSSSASQSPQHHILQQQQQQSPVRVKKEAPPTTQQLLSHASTLMGNSGNQQRHLSSPQQHQMHHHQHSPQQQQQQSSSPLPPQSLGNMAQALMHPGSLQNLRHPNREAILFRVKNEVQQQVAAAAGLPPQLMQPNAAAAAAAAAQRMVWVSSNARINGVKPEVIGGPLGNLRTGGGATQFPSPMHSSSSTSSQLSPQTPSQTPPRGTPTVIMGESCGVRTMVWGYEPPPPNASSNSGGPSPGLGGNQSGPGSSGGILHHQQQQHTQQLSQPTMQSSSSSQSHHSSQSSLQSASSPSAGSITPTHTPGPSPQNEEAAQLLLSLGQTRIQDVRPRPHQFRTPHALNMERLWAGDYSQLPPGQLHALNLSAQQQQWGSSNSTGLNRPLDAPHEPTDEDDQPLVCMICEDKATGLHYGIITCEGCKGFFKRTVQNRRVYTCVADGTCEITKAQRNRCQYCRFKKCIEQGMVLQAVREDRMPGGRNSGAVYNLYKVKYKKHKKSGQKQQQQQQHQQQQQQQQMHHSPHHQPQLSPLHHSHTQHPHHQALLSPQHHMHQQQLAAAAAAAVAAQHQQSKLLSAQAAAGLSAALGAQANDLKPMFLGPAAALNVKQEHAQQLHSPHHHSQQQHLSPHHGLHGSPHGGNGPPQTTAASHIALHSPQAAHLQQQQQQHQQQTQMQQTAVATSTAQTSINSQQSQQQHHHQHHLQQQQPPQHHHHSAHPAHQQQQQQQQQQHSQTQPSETAIKLPSHLVNGTILKTALTNPSEIVHLRHRLDSAVSSSKDRQISYEHALSMIQTLIDCDAMEDIATLPHFSEFLEDKSDISDKLCNIGDSIVHKLVSWTKKLPFYLEIPVEIHTKLLTDKWHEILILTTAAYQALHGKRAPIGATSTTQARTRISSRPNTPTTHHLHSHHNHQHHHHHNHAGSTTPSPPTTQMLPLQKDDPEFVAEVNAHLNTLQTCLTTLMGQPIAMEQLKLDVGHMVDKMTQITIMFRRIKLKMEEYVCLKVYILLNKEVELESIQERYIQVLKTYLQHTSPQNPQARLNELLSHIPEIQAAASLLLESKMFYVPFVLNSASIR